MTVGGRDLVPTHSMMLELADEYRFLVDGHEFLDQKRMLLAGETLRWLARYQQLAGRLTAAHQRAKITLAEAIARHGMDELNALNAAWTHPAAVYIDDDDFLGVSLRDVRCELDSSSPPHGLNPSPELRRCAMRFRELVMLAVELTGIASSLHRLEREYQRTERRARALEDVIMPEVREAMKKISEDLEEYEQEEAIRVRIRTK